MNIHIIDLDNILHVGTKAGRMGKFNTMAFPTGGLYRLFGLLKSAGVFTDPENNKAIVVYDKMTGYRRQIYPEYKQSRKAYKSDDDKTKDKAVQLQKEFVIDLLNKSGILVMGNELLEADDIMFNIALHFAWNPSQPLINGTNLILYSSDADWVGALGLAPNIYFSCTNSNSEKLNSIREYSDYMGAFGTALEYHYAWRAIYGDVSDGYAGYRDPSILNTEEMKTVTNTNYWNYFFWEELIKRYHGSEDAEILNSMLLNLRLAFPIYSPDIYNQDFLSMLNHLTIDKIAIKEKLEILRIKILEKELGKLNDFSDEHAEKMRNIIRNFTPKYQVVFDYYSKIQYIPKISTEDVDKAFSRTTIK